MVELYTVSWEVFKDPFVLEMYDFQDWRTNFMDVLNHENL